MTFELAFVENLANVGKSIGANGRSCQGIVRGGEGGVDDLVVAIFDEFRGALDFVEVKREVSGYRAVEPGLHKGCPFVRKFVQASAVVFAYPSYPAIYGLEIQRELCLNLRENAF